VNATNSRIHVRPLVIPGLLTGLAVAVAACTTTSDLDSINKRLDAIDARLGEIERRVDATDQRAKAAQDAASQAASRAEAAETTVRNVAERADAAARKAEAAFEHTVRK